MVFAAKSRSSAGTSNFGSFMMRSPELPMIATTFDVRSKSQIRVGSPAVFLVILMVPVERIELPTFGLQNRCSTAELNRHLEADWQAAEPGRSPTRLRRLGYQTW